MKTKILFISMVLSLLSISCSKDKNEETAGIISADEIAVSSKLDLANDDISSIIEDQYDITSANISGKSTAASAMLPACATVVRVPAMGTPITPGTTVTKTITFAPGCTMPNGTILGGSITMSFVYQPLATTQNITVTFNSFAHNNFSITGTQSLTRTIVATAAGLHPLVTVALNMTATNTTNGNVHTRTGTRVREFTQGFNTPQNPFDNVFKVTGNYTTTNSNGNVNSSTITAPIFIKYSCANTTATPRPSIFSEGVITTTRNGHIAKLDFGNGACDNIAVLTIDGVATTITIN